MKSNKIVRVSNRAAKDPRPQPQTRFLLDVMLGKLARWLRMLGYEAAYENDRTDAQLLSLAKQESLTLLTSDEELYRTATLRGITSYIVKGNTEPERLAELAERCKLELSIDPRRSRCSKCGSALAQVEKSKIAGLVPAATYKVYTSFWECTDPHCGKVYWQGSHWKKIEQTLMAAKKNIGEKHDPASAE